MGLVTGLLLGLLLKDYMLISVEAQTFQLSKIVTALEGSCVVIPCKFTNAKPKPLLRWLVLGTPFREEIYNSKNSSSVLRSYLERVSLVGDLAKGNCSMKINKVDATDNRYYFPQIDSDPPSYDSAKSHDSVFLFLIDNPEPIVISFPRELKEGNDYAIECSATHTCPANPPKLTWNFKILPAKTRHKELENGEWETVSTLNYKANSEHNGKVLKCNAEFPNGKTRNTQRELRILYPPKTVYVQSTHETGHVRKGEEVTLTCQSNESSNIANYVWYKDNQTISEYAFEILYIEGMTEDRSGQYYCVASNNVGETKSEPITLLCIDCESSLNFIYLYWCGVASAIVLVLILTTVVVVILYRRKKASMPPKRQTAEAPRETNIIYMNVQVPDNPKPSIENPYAALQTHNRCPDYEQLQLQDIQATNRPPLQTSSSYSEYEEVIPYRSQQKKKWKY
ncbi:B-cell receptor CD22-like [Mantella aurantiaca]